MKFENPIINISMFEVENVVTVASGETPVAESQTAAQKAAAAIQSADTQVVLSFND